MEKLLRVVFRDYGFKMDINRKIQRINLEISITKLLWKKIIKNNTFVGINTCHASRRTAHPGRFSLVIRLSKHESKG
jgi:hypothetical protein